MQTKQIILIIAVGMTAAVAGFAQPAITCSPTNQSVSLGASVSFLARATSTNPPITYQWRHDDVELPGENNFRLTITNVQMLHAGLYAVAASDAIGTTVSSAARLEVDPTFTKITSGEIVTDKRHWHGQAWGDYDQDGDLDLFLVTTDSTWNPIYRNNGDGTFTRVIERSLQGLHHNGNWFFSWVDYDNDGYLDLFLPDSSAFFGANYRNLLLHNKGNGTFTRVTGNPIVLDGAVSTAGA